MATVGGTGRRLHLRFFAEGIELPIIAAQIGINVNAPATASIQVVPADEVLELKPRTLVHLFYYDPNRDLPDPPKSKSTSDNPSPAADSADLNSFLGVSSPSVATSVTAGSLPDALTGYKLLFGGEIVGVAMGKTPTSRQMVLQCADWSSYWDTCYQMFLSFGPHGNFLTESSSVWAGGNNLFDDILDGHSAVMNRFLQEKPLTPGLTDIKGLMGGIIRLLEAMGGVVPHTHGVNDFFTIGELMRHLLQQITAEQDDDSAQTLFDNKEFWQWLEKGTMSLGEMVTFRDMLKLLFNWIYYEVVPVPTARYVPSQDARRNVATASDLVSADAKRIITQVRDIARSLSKNREEGDDFQEANQCFDLLAPLAEDLSFSKNLLSKLNLATYQLDVIRNPKNARQREGAAGDWAIVADRLTEALSASAGVKTGTKKVGKFHLDRLQTQIFRPDCFFAAPPKCNVFFPDQYTQINYQRNFLQEPTRLRLQTSWMFGGGGGDSSNGDLLAEYFYAPSISQIRDLAKKQGNEGLRSLLPWEIFTGVLPRFEHIAEINYISNKRQRDLNKDVKGKATSYSARTANFNYFKYRFAARTMEVSAVFSPQVVCGFPALVIDRPFIIDPAKISEGLTKSNIFGLRLDTADFIDSIQILAQKLGAPTQYLGMIAALSHNVDQSGGTTSVTMTHARTHRLTEDDFLQALAAEVTKETNLQDVVTVLDAKALLDSGDFEKLRLLIDITPQNIAAQASQRQQEAQQAQQDKAQGKEKLTLGGRPNETLQPADLRAVAVGLFANVTIPAFGNDPVTVNVTAPADARANVQQVSLGGTKTQILAPDPMPSKAPKKGPNGGKITQVEVFGDDLSVSQGTAPVVAVSRADINQNRKKNQKAVSTGSETIYLWQRAALHEEVTAKVLSHGLPIEEVIRPPWFSPIYSNFFIGEKVYGEFFGIGSIVDEMAFKTPMGTGVQGTNHKSRNDLLAEIRAADGDWKEVAKILATAVPQRLTDIPSVETAADSLAYLYGEVRRLGLDVHKFIADYTSRPIATLEDIFGSADLEYRLNGNKLELVQGTPGFHSTSVGPYQDLVGLLDNPDISLPRILVGGKADPISRALDPRPARRAKVLAYQSALSAGQGSLGVGLLG